MSGVFGILDSSCRLEVSQVLEQMAQQMSYFPWFMRNSFLDGPRVGLGRLGIGIFNAETQPLVSRDGRFVLFMSGELDNLEPLRAKLSRRGYVFSDQGDAELALHLFEEYGDSFVEHLKGCFVLALWDCRQQMLRIVNDRFGSYPLYYAHDKGRFIFAQEVKAILSVPGFEKHLDLTALADYIYFQTLLGFHTFFEGVRLLPGGSFLRYSLPENALQIQPYWDFSKIKPLPVSLHFEEAVEEATALLENAVNKYSLKNRKIGLFLSGGYDSRIILGLLKSESRPIVTVTFGQKNCRDVNYAASIAEKKRTRHHFFEFVDGNWVIEYTPLHLTLTEGFHSWIHAHGISTLSQVREFMEVNYSGLWGDDLAFNDVSLYMPQPEIVITSRIYDRMRQKYTWPSISEGEAYYVFNPPYDRILRHRAFEHLVEVIHSQGSLHPLLLPEAFVCYADAHSFMHYVTFHRSHIEERLPFYDYDYRDFISALPAEYRVHRRLRKAILRRKCPELCGIPASNNALPIVEGGWLLKAKVVRQVKTFVNRFLFPLFPEFSPLYADYEGWLRKELRPWAESILFSKRMEERGIFNMTYLRGAWERLQSGQEPNLLGKIVPFMTYEMLLERYLD